MLSSGLYPYCALSSVNCQRSSSSCGSLSEREAIRDHLEALEEPLFSKVPLCHRVVLIHLFFAGLSLLNVKKNMNSLSLLFSPSMALLSFAFIGIFRFFVKLVFTELDQVKTKLEEKNYSLNPYPLRTGFAAPWGAPSPP
jgi:hypothetical protein